MAAHALWRSQFSGCPVICSNRPALPTPAFAVGSRCLFCCAFCQRVLHQPRALGQRHGGLSLSWAALWAQRGADFNWLGGSAAHRPLYGQPIAAVCRHRAGDVGLRRRPPPSHSRRLAHRPCQRISDAKRGHPYRRRAPAHRLAALAHQRAMAQQPHSHHPRLRHAHRPAARQHPPRRPRRHPSCRVRPICSPTPVRRLRRYTAFSGCLPAPLLPATHPVVRLSRPAACRLDSQPPQNPARQRRQLRQLHPRPAHPAHRLQPAAQPRQPRAHPPAARPARRRPARQPTPRRSRLS